MIRALFFLSLFFTGCKVMGNYSYQKEKISETHQNETTFVYETKIMDYDYKIYNKINFDPNNLDRPAYYETSHEIWFW